MLLLKATAAIDRSTLSRTIAVVNGNGGVGKSTLTNPYVCTTVNSVKVVQRSTTFSQWLDRLKDLSARARIQARIDRAAFGNYGDHKWFDGIGEMRIHVGPGYRVYFIERGETIIVILSGGDKSTQLRDIERAKQIAIEWSNQSEK
jgi:putative addiction module killer protein